MERGEEHDAGFRNVFSGQADIVVQFRDIYGDLVIHRDAPVRSSAELAADALAEAVFRQWREEAKVWDVGGDRPTLTVRWKARPDPDQRLSADAGIGIPQVVTLDDMVESFLSLPRRRMVILGSPGSGKTSLAVLLALEVLRLRGTTTPSSTRALPVPVVLPLASWNPDREDFGSWLTRRLAEDYSGLPRIRGRHPGRELWAESRPLLLPVLDGLDEMPADRRSSAMRALNQALYGDAPVIVTSRTSEFASVARHHALRGAVVVEAQPVSAGEAVGYLSTSAGDQAEAWQPLFRHLRENPHGPVAAALSTPLMIWLCRVAHPGPEPDLARLIQFTNRQSVEDYLLQRFVPAAFTGDIPSGDRWEPPRRWPPQRAQRYLEALAANMQRRDTTELAWWHLHRTPLGRALALPLLALLGTLVSWLAVLVGAIARSHAPGDTFTFADGLGTSGLASQTMTEGILLALILRLITSAWYGDFRTGEPRRRASLLRPVAALRSAVAASRPRRIAVAGLGMLFLLAVSVILESVFNGSPSALTSVGACSLAACVLALLFTAPDDGTDATTPVTLMRSEQLAVWLTIGVICPLLAVAAAVPYASQSGVVFLADCVLAWLAAVTAMVLLSPWSSWLLAKASMAPTGQAPWLLFRFLRDAHRQGVLRQFGRTYQFRNIRLQERLASDFHDRPMALPLPWRGWRWKRPVLPRDAVRDTPTPGVVFILRLRRWSPAIIVAMVPLTAVFTLRGAVVAGASSPELLWVPAVFILGLGALLSCLSLLRRRTVLHLEIDRYRIQCYNRKNRGSRYDWSEVEDVAFRRTRFRGRETGRYGIHVRLIPGARPLTAGPHSDGDWYVVCVLGRNPLLPQVIEDALREYAVERWRPSVFAAVADPSRHLHAVPDLDNYSDDFAKWESER